MKRLHWIVFLINLFIYWYADCEKLVQNVENSLLITNHLSITKDRLIIDDAITERQLKVLLDYINLDPVLEQKNPTSKGFFGDLAKYSYKDMSDIHNKLEEAIRQKPQENRSSKSHLKEILFWKEMIAIELQIIDFAESFFRIRLSKKSSAIFARKRIKVDIPAEMSPDKLNNEEGWVVGIHADSCTFDSGTWKCSPPHDEEERMELSTRHVSIVMFLNELSDSAGGELVFLDPLQGKHKSKNGHFTRGSASVSDHSKISNVSSQPTPPSRESIRRALIIEKKNIKRKLNPTISENIKSDYIKAIYISENHINYTVVLPKMRRLAMFNSSVENVHAVTNLLNETDRRITYFMFLKIDA